MSRDFDRAVEIIFELEGYDEVIVDSGGLTKWGISQRAYPGVDIEALTKQDAKDLYQRDYWIASGAQRFAWPLNLYLFDAAVNQGVTAAIKMLQDAAGGLSIDGRLGRRTQTRVLSIAPQEMAARFMGKRAMRYAGTRHFDKYGYGWFSRLFRISSKSR